ncbi:SHB SH2 domain-containing adapter protein B [Salmonella enterica subsp. enterica serovar Sanjuan]|uniref:SHB SH2 domain-containing adapter protein B n=1 Tax=Salmonella enterica subsp. enterica serovar Sanjuan TaxID=1160765 RepID=A0A3S5DB76_SALET|nr:SHB SH2 domain-containing adapter protein B [Salmonella enterica subsp. enterica serovar Sanjuan]
MMRFRSTVLDVVDGNISNTGVLFDAPPQGNPRISQHHHAQLVELCRQIRLRVGEKATFTYSPHRVAGHNCLAVQVEGNTGMVNLLLTVTGSLRWPARDDYEHGVRWYINVVDAVDVVYLVREIFGRLVYC